MIFWSTRGRSDGFCWPHFKRAIIFLEWLQNKQFSNIQDSFKNWAPGLLAALKAGGKSCSGADGNSPHITSGEEVLNAIKSLSGGRSWSLLSGSSGHLISGQKVAPAPSGISGHQEACIFSSKSLWNSTCHCRLKQYSLNPFKSMIVVTFRNNHQWYVICHIRVMHGYCTCKTSSFFWLQTERLLRLGRWSFDWARLKIWCKGDCCCRRWVRWQILHFVFPPETQRFMKWYSSTIYTCFIVFVIFLEGPRLRKLADIHLIAEILHHQTHWQGITSVESTAPRGKKNLQPSPGSVLSLSCCRLSSLNMERRLMRFCRLGDIASPSMPPLRTSTTSLSSSGCSIAGSSAAKLGDAGATVGGRLSTTISWGRSSSTLIKGIFTSLWGRSASKSFHNNFSASSSSSTISSTDNGVVEGVPSSFPRIIEASKTRKAWRLLQSSLCLLSQQETTTFS